MKNRAKKLTFCIIPFVLLYGFAANAAWDEFVKTEQLLGQLNATTNKLVDVAKSHAELSERIVQLTESNMKSSESMESLTWQINILTYVLAIFALIQIALEISDRVRRRRKSAKLRGLGDQGDSVEYEI